MLNEKLKFLSLAYIHNIARNDLLRGMQNILSLPTPDNFICDVIEYQRGHRSINIKISEKQHPENYFYLQVENIFYFSGRFYWYGANFQMLTRNDSEKLFRKFPEFKKWDDRYGYLLGDFFLTISVVNSPDEITICASNYYLLIDKYTPEFCR